MCSVIVRSLEIGLDELERATGWQIRPEGACKGGRCVPLPSGSVADDRVDLRALAERLGMALVEGEDGLWTLGPESGGPALASAALPEVTLPDRNGRPFSLSSLRGTRFVMIAWASW